MIETTEIVDLYRERWSIRSIAKHAGVSYSTIRIALIGAGETIRLPYGERSREALDMSGDDLAKSSITAVG